MDKSTPIIELKGVGEKTQKLFAKLNLYTVGDLLAFYPRDYENFHEPVTIEHTSPGEVCAVRAVVAGIPNEKRVRNLHILNVNVSDGTGNLQLTFFNMPFLKKTLRQGGYYIFRGNIQTRGAFKIMEQPKIYSLEEYEKQADKLIPKYSLTKGLTNQAVQKAVKQALSLCPAEEEYYEDEFLRAYDLMGAEDALHAIHFPTDMEQLVQARQRLVFDEFFAFLILMRRNKEFSDRMENGYCMKQKVLKTKK